MNLSLCFNSSRRLSSLVLLFSLFLVSNIQVCYCSDDNSIVTGKPHSTVQELTRDNIDQALDDPANGVWLLKFYAPWCAHCKKMEPTLQKMAKFLSNKVAIGKMDCTNEINIELCKSNFRVKNYPTLKIYRDGDFHDYQGKRDADSMIDFLEKITIPAVKIIHSHEDAFQFLLQSTNNKQNVAFIAYDQAATATSKATDDNNSIQANYEIEDILGTAKSLQVFGQVARKMQTLGTMDAFGVIHPSVPLEEIRKFGIQLTTTDDDSSSHFLFKMEEDVDTPLVYNGPLSSLEFMDFVKSNNIPLITELTGHNFRSMGNKGKRLVIGVTDGTTKTASSTTTQSFIHELKEYARHGPHQSNYYFCHMDGKKWKSFLLQFDINIVQNNNVPVDIFILDVNKRMYWKNNETAIYSPDEEKHTFIATFISAMENGELIGKEKIQTVGSIGAKFKSSMTFIESIVGEQYAPFVVVLIFSIMFSIFYVLIVPSQEEKDKLISLSNRSNTSNDNNNSGERIQSETKLKVT